jgi:hypothetical protein
MTSSDQLAAAVEAPALLTVEEAAQLLRVGRSRAYELAREYLHSGGTAGMPVIRFGPSCLRVPRWALIELATTGRVVRLCDAVVAQATGTSVER